MNGVRVAVHGTTADPDVVEICVGAGASAYFVDLEHGTSGLTESIQAIRVAQAAGAEAHFRLPLSELHLASRLVDAGADGIHFADVRAPSDVHLARGALFHPPIGTRGYGGCRRNHFGQAGPEGWRESDPILGIQIESREGLQQASDILGSGHIGAVSVGTRDLAAALGHASKMDHPEVEAAIDQVMSQAEAWGIDFAMIARSLADYDRALALGASWILLPLASLLRGALCHYREH